MAEPLLIDAIKSPRSRPVKQLFLKKRSFNSSTPIASFEDDFSRIDNLSNRDIVLNWGSVSEKININPGRIDEYNIPSMRIKLDNRDGFFNQEGDERSLWNGPFDFVRKFSKIRVNAGYDLESKSLWDEVNWDEFNWADDSIENVFEGVIFKVTINDNDEAIIEIIGLAHILQQYEISDLNLPPLITAKNLIETIMAEKTIRPFIGFTVPSPGIDYLVTTSTLSGTYWDVIKEVAFKSNSVPIFSEGVFQFKERIQDDDISFSYIGRGSSEKEKTIYRINKFDEKGDERVRVFWKDQDSDLSATSTDSFLLSRYLGSPQEISLDGVEKDSDKLQILLNNLAEWEVEKPTIEFESKPVINKIKPLSKISISNFGIDKSQPNVAIFDQFLWDDGSVWAKRAGSINISSKKNWRVTGITKNIQNWNDRIVAEQIV